MNRNIMSWGDHVPSDDSIVEASSTHVDVKGSEGLWIELDKLDTDHVDT